MRFWPLQLFGWLGYSFATATVYSQVLDKPEQLAFRGVLLLGTFLASFGLREFCRRLWQRKISLVPALALCVVVSWILGVLSMAPAIWVERRLVPPEGPFPWYNALAGSVGAAFILQGWSALYFGFKYFRAAEELKIALLTAESAARLAQLRALQYQLQPHFLFNTLNAISSLVVSSQPQRATQMLSTLGVLLRGSLERPEVHTLALNEELATVEEYLSIERVRFGARLMVSLCIDPKADHARVPRFVLQPLIENAVRHGVAARSSGGEIVIRVHISGDTLQIEIENDIPPDNAGNTSGSGLGLRVSRERLLQLYGGQSALRTKMTENNRFLAVLTLPFEPSHVPLEAHQKIWS